MPPISSRDGRAPRKSVSRSPGTDITQFLLCHRHNCLFDGRSADEVAKRKVILLQRCDLVLSHIFRKNFDVRQSFREWLTDLMASSENPEWILHDEPLIIVAKYLGMDTTSIQHDDVLADACAFR